MHAQTTTQFVDVNERMPDPEVLVLVVAKPYTNKGYGYMFAFHDGFDWRAAEATFGWCLEEDFHLGDMMRDPDDDVEVIAWMPIPSFVRQQTEWAIDGNGSPIEEVAS